MTDIKTIRTLATAISGQFDAYATHHEQKNAMDKALTNLKFRNLALEIGDSLNALEAEFIHLRERSRDVSRVPDEHIWTICLMPDGNIFAAVRNRIGDEWEAIADTPQAALDAAIARITA